MEHTQQRQRQRGKRSHVTDLFVGIGCAVVFVISLCPNVNAQSLVNPVLVGPTINHNLANGTGMQVATVAGCTTAATIGSNCVVGLTFANFFPDTNYIAICGCNGSTAGAPAIAFESVVDSHTINALEFATTNAVATCVTIVCVGIHP